VHNVRQNEIHIAELSVPEPSSFEVEADSKVEQVYTVTGGTDPNRVWNITSTNILILVQIRKNYHSKGRNLLLYIFVKIRW
jgi:hypothetical protein